MLGHVYYGATDQLTLSTYVNFLVSGNVNAGVKYKLIESEAARFSVGAQYFHGAGGSLPALQAYLETYSNTRFISHVAVTVYLGNIPAANLQGLEALATLRSTIQTGYEVLLDNWDRVLAGPLYNLESKSVGAYLAYMAVWDHFHISVGVRTENVTQLELDVRGIYPYADVFWRF